MNTSNTTEPLPRLAWQMKHVAQALGCSTRKLQDIINSDPSFPNARMLGKVKTWKPSDIIEWYERQEVA